MERLSDIRLIAFDMDGTVFDNQKRVSERNMDALRRASEKGIYLVPASGRIYDLMPECIRRDLDTRYSIMINGSQVYDAVERHTLFRAEMSPEEAIAVSRYFRSCDAIHDCYVDGKGYMEAGYHDRIEQYCRPILWNTVRNSRQRVDDFEAFLRQQTGIQKVQAFFKHVEERERVLAQMERDFSHLQVAKSLPENIEVNAGNATKGAALEKLCQYLNVPLSETLAFGDGGNDVDMLQRAGIGVAMENAMGRAKKAADYITLSNEEDGVAVFLEKYVL